MVTDLSLVGQIDIREGAHGFLIHMRAAGYSQGYLEALEIALAFLADYAEEHLWPPIPQLTPAT